ncbi:hypothetical protein SISSUDRAFT_1061702 [Sistotremastrum suecicum HHB10207 ss-3]|uniref:G-protein coupled receptors family 1 profile domain-containing protein n=1 Tax=Sistotremastrum suecicum HHB10207 ss-3 TaxID=1314776 RepID=A0A166DPY1_9AGAM|nr:hypothetical protein SISSUDRAFT_1061702 [Sistotremastrum suecicum HHB10207 ss-3]
MAEPNSTTFALPVLECIEKLETGIGVSCGLYGILLTLFIITIHVFLFERRSRSSFILILSMLVLTLTIATAAFILTIINLVGQVKPVLQNNALSDCQGPPISRPLGALVPSQLLVVDTFTIYRTWLLYERRIAFVLFPLLCDVAMLALLLLNLIEFSQVWADALPLALGLPLSFILNTVCTIMIVVRLARSHLGVLQAKKWLIVPLVLLSGAIHNVVILILFLGIFTSLKFRDALILPVAITHTAAITFGIVVLQIAINKVFYQPAFSEVNSAQKVSCGDSESIEASFTLLVGNTPEQDVQTRTERSKE